MLLFYPGHVFFFCSPNESYFLPEEQMCGNSLSFDLQGNRIHQSYRFHDTSIQSPIRTKWGWVIHSENSYTLQSSGWKKWSHLRKLICLCGTIMTLDELPLETQVQDIYHYHLLITVEAPRADTWYMAPLPPNLPVGVSPLLKCKEYLPRPEALSTPYCRPAPWSQHSYWRICSLLRQKARQD